MLKLEGHLAVIEGLLRRCLRPLGRHRFALRSARAGEGFTLQFFLDIKKAPYIRRLFGGEGGIRTLDTLLTYTPLAGERLQPLGHFTINCYLVFFISADVRSQVAH